MFTRKITAILLFCFQEVLIKRGEDEIHTFCFFGSERKFFVQRERKHFLNNRKKSRKRERGNKIKVHFNRGTRGMDTRLLSLIGDITLTKQTALMTFNCLKVSVKSHQFKVFILRSTFHKSNHGKFKTIFVACVGLGVAAGAGYYLYRKLFSKGDEKEEASLMQVKMNHKIKSSRRMEFNSVLQAVSFKYREKLCFSRTLKRPSKTKTMQKAMTIAKLLQRLTR